MSIYTTIKHVIETESFRLSEMIEKINTLWAESEITGEEREELLTLAKEHLDPETERPESREVYERLEMRLKDVEERLLKLEGEEAQEPEEYPAWEPWDGISDRYQKGAKVSHQGRKWVSIYEGQNTWEPGAEGTETLWQEVE